MAKPLDINQLDSAVRPLRGLPTDLGVRQGWITTVQKLLGMKGAVDLVLTCSYYTAICMAQIALKPEMEGKASTL